VELFLGTMELFLAYCEYIFYYYASHILLKGNFQS
jgi:hypothetical protein